MISAARPVVNCCALRKDIIRFTQLYKGRRLREAEITPLTTHMPAVPLNHHLQLPRETATRWRAISARGTARERLTSTVWSPVEYGCHIRDMLRRCTEIKPLEPAEQNSID